MADSNRGRLGAPDPVDDRSFDHGEEDPLVELARIVSEDGGFYKPRTRRRRTEEPESEQTAPATPEQERGAGAFAPELEEELIREFEQRQATNDAPAVDAEPEPELPPQPQPDIAPDIEPVEELRPVEAVSPAALAVELDPDPLVDLDPAYVPPPSENLPSQPEIGPGDAASAHEDQRQAYASAALDYLRSQNEQSWDEHPLRQIEPEPEPVSDEPVDYQTELPVEPTAEPLPDVDPLEALEAQFRNVEHPPQLPVDPEQTFPGSFEEYDPTLPDFAFADEQHDPTPPHPDPLLQMPAPELEATYPDVGHESPHVEEAWHDHGPHFDPTVPTEPTNEFDDWAAELQPHEVRTAEQDSGYSELELELESEPVFNPEEVPEDTQAYAGPEVAQTDTAELGDVPIDFSPEVDRLAEPHDNFIDDDSLIEQPEEIAARPRERRRFGAQEFEQSRPSRAGMLAVAAVLAIAIIGGGVALTIGLSGGSGDTDTPPVIRADDSAVKVEPTNAVAAADEGDGSGVFDSVSGRTAKGEEKLVDRMEEPEDVSRIILPDSRSSVESEGQLNLDGDKIDARISDESTTPGEGPRYDPIGPRKVKTVIVKPDGTIVQPSEAAETAGISSPPTETDTTIGSLLGNSSDPSAMVEQPRPVRVRTIDLDATGAPVERQPETSLQPMETAVVEEPVDQVKQPESPPDDLAISNSELLAVSTVPRSRPANPPTRIAQSQSVPDEPVRATRAAPAQTNQSASRPVDLLAAAPAANTQSSTARRPPPTSSSGYVVQVSSQRSEEAARSTYQSLQRRFPGILGGYQASIQRAEIADKGTYYRVRVGPWQSKADAVGLCEQLKSSGGACFVTR